MPPIISETVDRLVRLALEAGCMEIRDVDAGEEPFLYSSGNRGPGYVNIKGLVSRTVLRDALVAQLAWRVTEAVPGVEFVAANVTGGVPPGVLLHQELSRLLARDVQLVYVRDTRKKGGLKEHVTGLDSLTANARGVVVEELVNYATTTSNSTILMRELGFRVSDAACIANYNTTPSRELLREHHITLTHLFTIEQALQIAAANEIFPMRLITSYREFLENPAAWMEQRGLVREEQGGTK